MRFEGTKRHRYEKKDVKHLRLNRKQSKPKRDGVTPEVHQFLLGDLLAAGHLKLHGVNKYQTVETETEYGKRIENTIAFVSTKYSDLDGERPHITGYLISASDADKKPYQIKGWINSDETIRIELVNHKQHG